MCGAFWSSRIVEKGFNTYYNFLVRRMSSIFTNFQNLDSPRKGTLNLRVALIVQQRVAPSSSALYDVFDFFPQGIACSGNSPPNTTTLGLV